ncbi:hypothetical protein Nepgr_021432 [Nepenthes gracilis]|uniref:Uncharacterized protein n=1 Tax=Nepenthes gracilis TaxID=150966 RepID=A0AAD3XXC7_NEPGR|nr:hypothetical protein Nepgr_021432 [Nepenthes gracilis]
MALSPSHCELTLHSSNGECRDKVPYGAGLLDSHPAPCQLDMLLHAADRAISCSRASLRRMKIGLGSLDGNGIWSCRGWTVSCLYERWTSPIGWVMHWGCEGLWSSLNLLMVLILGTVVVIDVAVLDYY